MNNLNLTLNLDSEPLFSRPASVSEQSVERTGEPMPVDAIMNRNNYAHRGAGILETVGQEDTRVRGWFSAADHMGNTVGSAPGFRGA